MQAAVKKQPGKSDMFLDSHFKPEAQWVRTRIMTEAGQVTPQLAITLVRCEVGDPHRFGYIHGQWWKLEDPAHEAHKPVASGQATSFTLMETEDGQGWQRLRSMFPERPKGGE